MPLSNALEFALRAREGMPASFVADGYSRACEAIEPGIRLQVEAEFANQISTARVWRRFLLHLRIESEVRRRTDAIAPPDARY